MTIIDDKKYATQIFGHRLRELSDAKGSYSQIARELGINRQQFARYLNGSSRPRDALVLKMAEYFDVEVSTFFRSQPYVPDAKPVQRDWHAIADSFLDCVAQFDRDVVTEADLPSGFYMQYKQSFTQVDRVVCMLSRIERDRNGVVRCKRRYSTLVVRDVTGIDVSHTSYGVFIKNLGNLVYFETDGVAGDLVFSAFKPSSMFTVADRVRTGVVMTHGRLGGVGPVAGRHMIEKVPDGASILEWARRQGFRTLGELPDYIQHHFASPPTYPEAVMATR
ncbi:MAG: helix-turn-helix transcriptional regulator [Pseudomonadota bacterium]